jgi:hypothetical protein
MSADIIFNHTTIILSRQIVIGGGEVTVAARTNSLLIGLTIALVALALLEVHVDEPQRVPLGARREAR